MATGSRELHEVSWNATHITEADYSNIRLYKDLKTDKLTIRIGRVTAKEKKYRGLRIVTYKQRIGIRKRTASRKIYQSVVELGAYSC